MHLNNKSHDLILSQALPPVCQQITEMPEMPSCSAVLKDTIKHLLNRCKTHWLLQVVAHLNRELAHFCIQYHSMKKQKVIFLLRNDEYIIECTIGCILTSLKLKALTLAWINWGTSGSSLYLCFTFSPSCLYATCTAKQTNLSVNKNTASNISINKETKQLPLIPTNKLHFYYLYIF